jgi:hypothetical protein
MSKLYGPHHRALQDRFDMRRLADGIEQRNVRSEISPRADYSAWMRLGSNGVTG